MYFIYFMGYHAMALFVKLLFILVAFTTAASINISLGFLSPLDETLGPLSVLGKELESAFKLAVKIINSEPKYTNYIQFRTNFPTQIKDETANSSDACLKAASEFNSNDLIVGVIGGYYSACSISFQNFLNAQGSILPQISYRSLSTELSDKETYPHFYRVSSTNKEQAQVIVDIVKNFHWSKVGIIHSDDKFYGQELSNEIFSKCKSSNIYIVEKVSFTSGATQIEVDEKLQIIKSSGSRINIIVAQGQDVFTLFKNIKAQEMNGAGWVWIGADGVTSLDFESDPVVKSAALGLLGVNPMLYKGRDFFDLIIKWYQTGNQEEYPGRIWKKMGSPSISPYVGQVVRAVSTLHSVLERLAKDGSFTQLTNITIVRKMLQKGLENLNSTLPAKTMLGGDIFFKENNEAKTEFTITNYVNDEFIIIGSWQEGLLDLTRGNIKWPGGGSQTPVDQSKTGKELFRIGFVAPIHPSLGSLSEYGKEWVSAFNVALDIINKDSSINIELGGFIYDEGIDGSKSCLELAKDLAGKNLVAIVGAYRSECSMKVHNVLVSKKIPIVSYASSSKLLSDKSEYKNFFRIVSSSADESEVLKHLVLKYAFKDIAVLYGDDFGSAEVVETFITLIKDCNVSITASQKFPCHSNSSIIRNHVLQIRQSGARVIIMAALPKDSLTVVNLIKELNMVGKGWIWFSSTSASLNHFNSHSNANINGMLGVLPKGGNGKIYAELLSAWKLKDSLKYPGNIHSTTLFESLPYTAQVYDAVNVIALALSDLVARKVVTHTTGVMLIRSMLMQRIRDFDSTSNGFLSATSFAGKMYFDKLQNGPPIYDVVNLQDTKWRTVGYYDGTVNRLIEFIADPIFPGGGTLPVLSTGKVIYEVAAFLPNSNKLGELAEVGKLWSTALKGAVNWVNKNELLNVGFDLTVFDAGVSPLDCYQAALNIPATIDLVIDASPSLFTDKIYSAIEEKSLPMLTFASPSSIISKKENFSNLFRVCPSDTYQAMVLVELIKKFFWEKIGILTVKGMYEEALAAEIKDILKSTSIQVTTLVIFEPSADTKTEKMKELKQSGAAVNLIIANPKDVLQIYQEAFEMGMTGKGWTWIGSEGATSASFKRSQNLQHNMQGMIGIRPKVGYGSLFDVIYNEWLNLEPAAEKNIPYVSQAFDAIIVSAFAMHQLHADKLITPVTTKEVSRRLFIKQLKSMKNEINGYDSSTGKRLYFDYYQDVIPTFDLINLNGANWVSFGSYEYGNLDITRKVVWAGGTIKIPSANPPNKNEKQDAESEGTSDALIVLAVVFSVFGFLVIIFMIYIVRRVRHRHLYMQSDLNQGGVFSVLYGHNVSRTNATAAITRPSSNWQTLKSDFSPEATLRLVDPKLEWNAV